MRPGKCRASVFRPALPCPGGGRPQVAGREGAPGALATLQGLGPIITF